MPRLGTMQTTESYRRTRNTNGVSKTSDGFATDVNPLIRQWLLAREVLKESPKRQAA